MFIEVLSLTGFGILSGVAGVVKKSDDVKKQVSTLSVQKNQAQMLLCKALDHYICN